MPRHVPALPAGRDNLAANMEVYRSTPKRGIMVINNNNNNNNNNKWVAFIPEHRLLGVRVAVSTGAAAARAAPT